MLQANRSTSITIDGKDYLYFGGTNYLGLAHRKELLQAADKAFAAYGWSSGASRLTSGENDILLELEYELAKFANAESALVLPAGFMSNQAVVEGLDDSIAAWIVPRQSHASIHAAVNQSKKPVVIVDSLLETGSLSLRKRLQVKEDLPLGIFAEPIEALHGSLSPIAAIAEEYGASDYMILDEAQSFGVLGERGSGALEFYNLQKSDKLIRTGTFSKAVGTYGGFVLSSKMVADSIKQKSACFRGSTSLPPLVCAATHESLRLIQTDSDSTVRKLHQNIAHLNSLLSRLKIEWNQEHCVPIYHLPYTPSLATAQEQLPKQGIFIPSMTNYFPDAERIGMRWTIQAGHTAADLDRLFAVLL